MKIAVLSIYPFPYGMAATNRIAAYAQGLVENGVDVDVISIHPAEPPCSGKDRLPDEGCYNGVHYIHPSGRYRSSSRVLRGLAMKSGFRFWRGAFKVRQLLKRNRYDAVILSFDEPQELNVYARLAKKYGSKVIFIFDEYPIPIRHELKPDIPQWKKEAYRRVLPLIDGYIAINDIIRDYYNTFHETESIVVSIIIDLTRFALSNKERFHYISYIGNMDFEKDNVMNVVKAFALIRKKYPDYKIRLWGQMRKQDLDELTSFLDGNEMSSVVEICGCVSSDKVPPIMQTSKILVSSQCNNLRTQGGLSTKIGEYVASGTPTLLCDVGENKKYLSEEDCFYVEPENPIAYAEKLDYILSNYDQALKVAEHGRQTIVDKYSHVAAGKKIKKFVESLI